MQIAFLVLASVGAGLLYWNHFILNNAQKAESIGFAYGLPLLLIAVGLAGYFLVKNR